MTTIPLTEIMNGPIVALGSRCTIVHRLRRKIEEGPDDLRIGYTFAVG